MSFPESDSEVEHYVRTTLGAIGKEADVVTDIIKREISARKNYNKIQDDYHKSVKKGRASLSDHERMIEIASKKLDELSDSSKGYTDEQHKAEIQSVKKTLADSKAAASTLKFEDAITKTTTTLSKDLYNVLTGGIGKFTKGLQSNATSSELSADLMNSSIDLAGSSVTGLADTVSAVGGKFANSMNPVVAGLGVLGVVVGELGKAASGAGIKLAKFGVDILSREVDKTIKSFNDLSSAGALFANGMDDMRKYSALSGLTLEEFSNTVKNNSSVLAESGYSVTGGAQIIGKVTSRFAVQIGKSGNTLQTEMLNLGLNFQEQAELAAKVTGDLRRTGGTATNGQIASATADLAKNMRIIADITGEDAKAKMDQAKKQAEQYAFFAKVNEIAKRTNDPGLPKRVEASLALLDDTQRRAAIQATVLNGAVTDLGANVLGQADAGREYARNLLSGTSEVTQLVRGFAQAGDTLLDNTNEIGRSVSIANIAAGQLGDLATAATSLGQQAFKVNSKNLENAVADATAAQNAKGETHQQLMSAEQSAHDLKNAIQNDLTEGIKQFAKVSNEMLKAIEFTLDQLGLGKKKVVANTSETAASTAIADEISRRQAIGLPKSFSEFIDYLGSVMATNQEGYAEGGVATGPKTGYNATLHGTEAVVPLPDGKTIPVNIDTSAITNVLNEIHDTLKDTKDLNKKIMQNTA